jgi:hypothetical protein
MNIRINTGGLKKFEYRETFNEPPSEKAIKEELLNKYFSNILDKEIKEKLKKFIQFYNFEINSEKKFKIILFWEWGYRSQDKTQIINSKFIESFKINLPANQTYKFKIKKRFLIFFSRTIMEDKIDLEKNYSQKIN